MDLGGVIMNEQLYKKVGRRYIPIGYSDGFSGFPSDGIWLVQQKDGCKSSECIIKYEDLETARPAVGMILEYKDRIMKFILKCKHIRLYDITIHDFVTLMLKEITWKQ